MNETSENLLSTHQRRVQLSPVKMRAVRAVGFLGSFGLGAAGSFLLTMNVAFHDSYDAGVLSIGLATLLLLHTLRYLRLLFCREFILYACFFTYMLVQLLWTPDVVLARNTLVPAFNFILTLLLFGSLMTYHAPNAVLAGMFSGFVVTAALYTLVVGFPFVRPAEFSYNAIGAMYLFGLFVTLFYSCHQRSAGLLILAASILGLLILATTSIKTILGVAFGILAGALAYLRHVLRALGKHLVVLTLFVALIAYFIKSNEGLIDIYQTGIERALLGIELLRAREALPGYDGFENRAAWIRDGLAGWFDNPVFGHGVEAFRSRYGMTSHTTPVDLLYNSGLIGLLLFYSIFVSMMWRLLQRYDERYDRSRAVILGAAICYFFVMLSGTLHYNAFLGAFIGLSTGFLRTHRVTAAKPLAQ